MKNDESSYSSDPFDVPSGEFKIFVEGWDSIGIPIFQEFTVGNEINITIDLDETFGYGFSVGIPNSKVETSDQPIKGKSNRPIKIP